MKNNNDKKPRAFIFESYRLDVKSGTIYFHYSFDNGLKFTETITLGRAKINWPKINRPLVDRLIFNLHLALGIGYYKAYCPKKIIIKSGALSRPEAEFWNKLYTKGLGEFFYRNRIDFRGLIKFPFQKNKNSKAFRVQLDRRVLLPWGGGKDSCVSAELLREMGHDFTLITLRDSDIQKDAAKITGQPRIINGRNIDPALMQLNQAGAYNGHIPISAIYSWTTALSAVLYDYRYIVYSNEASANYGNVKYLGQEINHQYSKSLEFENDFRTYLNNFVSPDIQHFSLLRQFSDLKISRSFSRYEQYFPAFSSCNRNFSITKKATSRWCGECPKCLFTFSQLAAYIDKEKLIKIFGQNLFARKDLLPLFQELWGEKKFKPFDCVGTPLEVKAALLLCGAKKDWRADYIIKEFNRRLGCKINNPGSIVSAALKNKAEHNIPDNFRPTLILGFGREGQSAYDYLRKKYPDFKFGIADRQAISLKDSRVAIFSGKKYLDAVSSYELIIKTPGISNREPELVAALNAGREISSLTNLFLSIYGRQTIGVTGTKGKSTTASLIYEILKAAGKNVYLIGNIGVVPLDHLLAEPDKNKIFVYELSSHQLDDSRYSPHISVFINIFPDHLPYHGGFKNYFAAKANIAKKQTADDYLIYNESYPLIKKLAANSPAKKISYRLECSIGGGYLKWHGQKIIRVEDVQLLGEHNLANIQAAVCASKIYGADNASIKKAVGKFTNLRHRLEFVGRFKGIDFYDDAISTTPESTLAAIEVFKDKLDTIILGGENRGYKFKELAERLAKLKVRNYILFPDSGREIKLEIEKSCRKHKLGKTKILFTRDMAAAVKFAYCQTAPGKVCLLSTASPSYSIFKDFNEKGDLFQAAIKKYPQ